MVPLAYVSALQFKQLVSISAAARLRLLLGKVPRGGSLQRAVGQRSAVLHSQQSRALGKELTVLPPAGLRGGPGAVGLTAGWLCACTGKGGGGMEAPCLVPLQHRSLAPGRGPAALPAGAGWVLPEERRAFLSARLQNGAASRLKFMGTDGEISKTGVRSYRVFFTMCCRFPS